MKKLFIAMSVFLAPVFSTPVFSAEKTKNPTPVTEPTHKNVFRKFEMRKLRSQQTNQSKPVTTDKKKGEKK